MYSVKGNQQTQTFDNHTLIKGGQIFHEYFCRCLIVDSLMQHKFSLCESNWYVEVGEHGKWTK